MKALIYIFRTSRPRFWIYLLGPYLVGAAAGASTIEELISPRTLIFAFFFTLPANLALYGINDIFDFETDRLNPKKNAYEVKSKKEYLKQVVTAIILLTLPFVLAAFFLSGTALISLVIFFALSFFYSAPPIRAKAIPFLDSVFNILYVFPAAFSFQMLTGKFLSIEIFIAGWFWTMAMHAFSAIPDIEADKKASVDTIATFLGKNGTLYFCLVSFTLSAIFAFSTIGFVSIVLGTIYVLIIAAALLANDSAKLFQIYKIFPFVNTVNGFILFWIAAAKFL